jgi:tetratricopeptide (TPR) repeat protein
MLNWNARLKPPRRTFVALFATLVCLAPPLAGADDLQDAQQLLQSGQREQALEQVNKILAAKPKDAQARFLKGLILTEQGKQAEAIEIYTKLTQDYPNLPEPYNNLAVIYAGQGQYEKARASLEQSIRTHPSYATAYENLGDVYAKLASQAYGKALQLDASNTGAQNKLSLVRELVGGTKPAALAKADGAKPAEAAEPPKVAAVEPQKPVEQKPVEQKPAPLPAPAAAPAAEASSEVLEAVKAWAQAWSRKDADAYLAYYAKDFDPPGSESRADWEKARRQRIEAPKSISVSIESPKVTMQGHNEAAVSFRQNYRSDKLKSSNRKTLQMVKTENGWQIRKEDAGK